MSMKRVVAMVVCLGSSVCAYGDFIGVNVSSELYTATTSGVPNYLGTYLDESPTFASGSVHFYDPDRPAWLHLDSSAGYTAPDTITLTANSLESGTGLVHAIAKGETYFNVYQDVLRVYLSFYFNAWPCGPTPSFFIRDLTTDTVTWDWFAHTSHPNLWGGFWAYAWGTDYFELSLDPAHDYLLSTCIKSEAAGDGPWPMEVSITLEGEVIPVPGAALLGVLGLGTAGWRLRRGKGS